MKKHVIAYLHTHWDREWYREFEIFRMRLLRVFDNVLDMLTKNQIPSFYFDGQVSALEDYLEMRPEKRETIENLIRRKKLFIGPFYCLVDEFLTDKKCFAKNLEIGIKKAQQYGCNDFIGYLADTFGHSQNVVDVMRDYGIDKCMVWRGCPKEIPSDFKWCGMDTVNLIRGYFHDEFSIKTTIEEKAKILKREFDLIVKNGKNENYILFPIGADHLGIETDIAEQIKNVNEFLKDDYFITLGSPFDYFKCQENNFKNFRFNDELRDNSQTFTLQGCYSSRLDLKRFNVECSYKLDLAERMKDYFRDNRYNTLIEHGYKLLIQNQAHDSICGCSTDEVHQENKIRYKKVLQVANGIIDELKFKNGLDGNKILNLSSQTFTGNIEFESTEERNDFEEVSKKYGFDKFLLADTQRIPITEDYTVIHSYITRVENVESNDVEYLMPIFRPSDLSITENYLKNSYLNLKIKDKELYLNETKLSLVDFVDLGDSYNFGPKDDDYGKEYKVLKTKVVSSDKLRSILRIDFENSWDIITLFAALDAHSRYIKFYFEWENTRKNHLLCFNVQMVNPIKTVFSEDMNTLIKREFNPEYDIRVNLPKEKGIEAKNNTAPMQRGLLTDDDDNNIGIITKGLTQYEVFKNNLYIPILRATGQISNPKNPARTTPAGPPIETFDSQMIGQNCAEMYLFFGNENDFFDTLNQVYNYIVI